MYIPDGFGTVFPYIFATNAKSYLVYLQHAFGAEILGCLEQPPGQIANALLAPMDMPYGDRQGGVIDPSGNSWWISTRFQQQPYD